MSNDIGTLIVFFAYPLIGSQLNMKSFALAYQILIADSTDLFV